MGLFGVLSVFGRRIKAVIRLRPEEFCCGILLDFVCELYQDARIHEHQDKSSTLVEVYRRYVAFVYLYETVHRHVPEDSNFIYLF
jgi:hypothetical protein